MIGAAAFDDRQGVAEQSADWTRLREKAEIVFFRDAFASDDDAAARLRDFDALMAMRERTVFPASLVQHLLRLCLFNPTVAPAAAIDMAALRAQGATITRTGGEGTMQPDAMTTDDYAGTPLLDRIADSMSNGAYVIGTRRAGWRQTDLSRLQATLRVDSAVAMQKTGAHPTVDPILPAVALVNARRATTGVAAGQVTTAHTYTGLHQAAPCAAITAEFTDVGTADVVVTRRDPIFLSTLQRTKFVAGHANLRRLRKSTTRSPEET